MVGNIGMLHAPQVGPVEKAVDYAFTLVAGWQKKDRAEIERALTELKAAAENNSKVYAQASKALNDLSRREAAARELEAAAREAKESAEALVRENAARVAREQQDMDRRQALLNEAVRAHNQAVADKERSLDQRETAAHQRERALAARETAAIELDRAASKTMDEARAVRSDYETKISALRALVGGRA